MAMPLTNLTERELQILRLMALGLGADQIANDLGIQISTVRKHIDNTLKKFEARSQLEAIAKARQEGILGL